MIKYIFRDEPLGIKNAADADPQKIGEALAAVAAANGGEINTEPVIEAASNKRHILHKHFEWDDKLAAHAHRKDQARALIRCVRIVREGGEEPAPAFISLNSGGGVSYRPLQDVLDSRALQLQALKQADRDLEAFERRYRQFVDICDLVKAARDRAADRRAELESRPQ